MTPWTFEAGKVNSKLKYVRNPQIFRSQCTHWIKEVQITEPIDELMTSRSIVGRADFPDFDMLDAMIASALKKSSQHADTFPKESSFRRAACEKHDRFLRGRQTAYMIYEYFRATGACEAVQ